MIKSCIVTIILFLFFTISSFAEAPFPDVPEYHEYANEITYVKNREIVSGYSDGLFRPDSGITRGELIKIVVNAEFSQNIIEDCVTGRADIYPDIHYDHIFAKYICVAKKNNIVKGYSDGNFKPEIFVTFGESSKVIIRTLDEEMDISEDADLDAYISRLDEKDSRPIRLVNANKDEYINRGEVAFLIQMTLDNYVVLPDESQSPVTGYREEKIDTGMGLYTIKSIAADLTNTKVIVDTASSSDCADNCPVKSLSQYVTENGAYAGVNGSYFCPADSPSCAGKANSFLSLIMNKDKVYFNSEHAKYSPDPVAVFGNNYVRFIEQASEWSRDTSIDSVFSNYPLLIFDQEVRFAEAGDGKQSIKSNRSFLANKGNIVYIGVAYNVTVAESAQVMRAMEMDNAINLDAGGSTALWYEGYKAGPGRGIPNAILFLRK